MASDNYLNGKQSEVNRYIYDYLEERGFECKNIRFVDMKLNDKETERHIMLHFQAQNQSETVKIPIISTYNKANEIVKHAKVYAETTQARIDSKKQQKDKSEDD